MKYHTRPAMLIISFVFYTQYEVKKKCGIGEECNSHWRRVLNLQQKILLPSGVSLRDRHGVCNCVFLNLFSIFFPLLLLFLPNSLMSTYRKLEVPEPSLRYQMARTLTVGSLVVAVFLSFGALFYTSTS
jgi:hypothetical protein